MLARVTGVLATAVVAMVVLMVPAAASAAAPANDNFADREVLSGTLPIEVTRSNDEATKESGEFIDFTSPAGHSVWFEWEATTSGWVTISSCDADFRHGMLVHTGSAVGSLTKVGSGSGDGPACPYGFREYTFEAEVGTKYEIAVDGNNFTPGGPPPDTEGTFTLRIEQTPLPPNDDFADAIPLVTSFQESWEGEDNYGAFVNGFNWNATTEPGEPVHGSGSSGASVWYRWTPPVDGMASFGACCGTRWRMDVYEGSGFGDLQTVASGLGVASGGPPVAVTAGTEYWMVLYGLLDVNDEFEVGGFNVQLWLRAPTPAKKEDPPSVNPPGPPAPDLTPPQTTISKRLLSAGQGRASFRFASSEPGSSFRCRLDRRPLRACKSPAKFKNLGAGWHTFRVVATDPAGNADPSAAVARFKFAS